MTQNNHFSMSIASAADLSGKEGLAVMEGASGVNLPTLNGQKILGVILRGGGSDGQGGYVSSSVLLVGLAPVIFGGTVAAGDEVTVLTTGKFVKAVPGDVVAGIAHEGGAADEWGSVWMRASARRGMPQLVTLNVALANLDNDYLLNGFVPGFAGSIKSISAVVTLPTTDTTGKQAIITPQITASGGAETPTTGGVLTIDTDVTAKDPDTMGKVIAGTTITAANVFEKDGAISLKCSDTTSFTVGGVSVIMVIEPR